MNSCGCQSPTGHHRANALTLAIATVPVQMWSEPYDPAAGLKKGTIFPDLYLPFYKGGENHG